MPTHRLVNGSFAAPELDLDNRERADRVIVAGAWR